MFPHGRGNFLRTFHAGCHEGIAEFAARGGLEVDALKVLYIGPGGLQVSLPLVGDDDALAVIAAAQGRVFGFVKPFAQRPVGGKLLPFRAPATIRRWGR